MFLELCGGMWPAPQAAPGLGRMRSPGGRYGGETVISTSHHPSAFARHLLDTVDGAELGLDEAPAIYANKELSGRWEFSKFRTAMGVGRTVRGDSQMAGLPNFIYYPPFRSSII